ncbi:transient receptor potential cation channel subfamily M member-like 2 [Ptychodera flava]|uniref:transient receptor potential cation channel subfamily M member-like 2 n=1 Tax=Ptychodera flava TaxID=63121 RepID=UPI00396A1C36
MGDSSEKYKSQVHHELRNNRVEPHDTDMAKDNKGFGADPETSVELKAIVKKEMDTERAPGRVLDELSSEEWQNDISSFIKVHKIKQRKSERDGDVEDVNSFGEIEFIGFGQSTNKRAPYIRVAEDTPATTLWKLLVEQWKIPKPKVLISVTGGAQNFFFKDDRLKILFNKGLFKAAISTGAWIITGGTATGVMKKVGEAIKEESQGTTENEVVALGIATWNVIDNNNALTNTSSQRGCWPAKYAESDLNREGRGQLKLTALDCNHTHFILVDHGKQSYGADIELRAKLEQFIAKNGGKELGNGDSRDSKKENTDIPVVLVVVEGGYGTIETVYQSLGKNNEGAATEGQAGEGIPVVIVDGSGRAADIIAEALRLRGDNESANTIDGMKDSVRSVLKGDRNSQEDCISWLKQISAPSNRKLITVFHMNDANFKDIDRAILHGVLQAQTLTGKTDKQLRLAVALNRCDIAKDHIITAERQPEWQGNTDSLDEIMFLALRQNKADFVELFLAHIVDMDRFLTYDRLWKLYDSVVRGDVGDADIRISTGHILKEKLHVASQPSEEILEKVGSLLRKLTEDEYDALYQERPKEGKKVSDPDKHLFLWAVLLNRRALAILFWKRLATGNIGAALIAGRILRALSVYAKEKEELTLHFDLLKHADEFEHLATGVLESCYEADKDLSKLALVRTLPAWGNTTCLSIAYSAKHMNFMEHDCCQSKLQRVWKGNLLIHSTIQWLKFFVGTILPIFPFMTFLAKDFAAIYERDGDKKATSRKFGCANYFFRWRSVYPKMGTEVRQSGFKEEDVTFWEGMRYFYTAPISKFLYSMVSYIILLLLFAYFILTDLRPNGEANSPGIIEWIVVIWVGTLVVEEVRQLIVREPKSMKYKAISWFSEVWNRFDLAMYLLFAVSLVLRLVLPPSKFSTARVMYCVTFIAFCVRLLHMGFVFKEVGPKIIMIIKMIKDLTYFLFILIVFIAGFGIANEAILYPNMEPHFHLMVRSLYKPYWQLYGELFLEEIEGLVENETCYEDPRFMNVCPQVEEYRWVAPTLTAIYMLISNILLINLLIAMFSFTFQRVQDNAEVIWRFYRFGLISEYQDRPTLAPPLIVINHLYRFIIYLNNCTMGKTDKKSHSLSVWLEKGSRTDENLNLFERKHLQNYFIKKNQQRMNSIENTVSSTDKRLDNVEKIAAEILKLMKK